MQRPEHHNVYGGDYDKPKNKLKENRFNYETQQCFGNFLRIQSSIRNNEESKEKTLKPTEVVLDNNIIAL